MWPLSLKSKAVAVIVALTFFVLLGASAAQMYFMRQDMTRMLSAQQFMAAPASAFRSVNVWSN